MTWFIQSDDYEPIWKDFTFYYYLTTTTGTTTPALYSNTCQVQMWCDSLGEVGEVAPPSVDVGVAFDSTVGGGREDEGKAKEGAGAGGASR